MNVKKRKFHTLSRLFKKSSSFSLECSALAKIDVTSQDGRSAHIVGHIHHWPITKRGFQAGHTEHHVTGAAMLLAGFTEANLLSSEQHLQGINDAFSRINIISKSYHS